MAMNFGEIPRIAAEWALFRRNNGLTLAFGQQVQPSLPWGAPKFLYPSFSCGAAQAVLFTRDPSAAVLFTRYPSTRPPLADGQNQDGLWRRPQIRVQSRIRLD
jgi:hypothetical protein